MIGFGTLQWSIVRFVDMLNIAVVEQAAVLLHVKPTGQMKGRNCLQAGKAKSFVYGDD